MNAPSSRLLLAIAPLAFAATACSASATATTEPHAPLAAMAGSDRAADLCAGLSAPERERPYFLREEAIEAVRPVHEEGPFRSALAELRGAEIVLRPAPTVTKHWVSRVLRCHLVDPVALALRDPIDDDPLTVGAPSVSVDQRSDRVVLRIVGRDAALGEEILRRAEQLQRQHGSPED